MDLIVGLEGIRFSMYFSISIDIVCASVRCRQTSDTYVSRYCALSLITVHFCFVCVLCETWAGVRANPEREEFQLELIRSNGITQFGELIQNNYIYILLLFAFIVFYYRNSNNNRWNVSHNSDTRNRNTTYSKWNTHETCAHQAKPKQICRRLHTDRMN